MQKMIKYTGNDIREREWFLRTTNASSIIALIYVVVLDYFPKFKFFSQKYYPHHSLA
jgi:hypothetical protein